MKQTILLLGLIFSTGFSLINIPSTSAYSSGVSTNKLTSEGGTVLSYEYDDEDGERQTEQTGS